MNSSTAYRDGYCAGQLLLSLKKKVKTRQHVYKTYSFLQLLLIWGSAVIVFCFFYLSRLGGFQHKPQQDEPMDTAVEPVTVSTEQAYPEDSF
ncbi:hypothetical protein AB6D34_18445 [Pectobacterium brasiliense]|uniref:Uncharacterized protein n=3 Tax=Pectobacterium TaxID=122277 RepID=A0A3S0ZTG1_9GAMM|nr:MULTISPECIES: hypothetical protein [Pectobacterium]GKW29444.1 hypothetical protein PEC331060_26220 [Pectobacterium carotovorum subsp. carotovorum]MBA5204736.1 hypothetical protein [Pectobacterium aroidearum]MBN3048075.1 hypothetical protein [Pectobacterium brasiliense]MBN3057050.1 hypothetical protein [Pectobacterium brasiliense]MBN3077638.1 hypothetical protein [Pectobacterium brasiliense]